MLFWRCRPGYAFRDEKLYAFAPGSILVVSAAWPDLRAWHKTRREPRWRHCRPAVHSKALALSVEGKRPVFFPPCDQDGQLGLPFPGVRLVADQMAVATWQLVFERIPTGVKRAIQPFSDRHFHLMSLCARCPGALDLCQSNPALAYALASNWVFHRPRVRKPMRAARSLLRRKQRHTLGWLGFGDTEAARKITRKLPPRAVSIAGLLYLRDAMANERILRRLSFVTRINASTIRLVSDPTLASLVSQSFLEEAGRRRGDDRVPRTAYLVMDARDLAEECGRRLPLLRSVRHARQVLDELAWEQKEVRACTQHVPFPAPPLAGTDAIHPITDMAALAAESVRQRNCVIDCAERIFRGSWYLYRLLAPQRATFSIVPGLRGWRLEQIKARNNRPVGPAARRAVQRWLDQAQRPG